jgi:hypothetical protein
MDPNPNPDPEPEPEPEPEQEQNLDPGISNLESEYESDEGCTKNVR